MDWKEEKDESLDYLIEAEGLNRNDEDFDDRLDELKNKQYNQSWRQYMDYMVGDE